MTARLPRAAWFVPSGSRAALLPLLAMLVAFAPAPACAGVEEFSTFDVEIPEKDDESLIDHLLARPPREWRDDWEHATLAVRSAQGCLTAGEWHNQTDLKLRTSLGRRSWFGFALRQYESDEMSYDYMEFSFHVPTRLGTAGFMFRPSRDKSSQDMALMWDVGEDTSTVQLHAVFGLEDVFNNFWEFRQSETGGRAQPYLRHPWEPGLSLTVRQPRWRAELGGRWLTPGTRRVISTIFDPSQDHLATLWGTRVWAAFEARALGIDWEARTVNHQAQSTDHPRDAPFPDGLDYRRQWSLEASARRPLTPRLSAEGRWIYQERRQDHAPPVDPTRFEAVDRAIQLETLWSANANLSVRLGAMRDRIGLVPSGATPFNYGTRSEDRAYVGLMVRFGQVSLQGIEGIELDHEPYKVWLVHDKGFLSVQARF